MSVDSNPTQHLWLDLETTGLDPEVNCIVELSAKLTHLDRLSGDILLDHEETYVIKPVKDNWNAICVKMHQESGLLAEIEAGGGITLAEAVSSLTSKVRMRTKQRAVVLAGRTVHFDRMFLRVYFPELEAWLHHRHFDMSAIEIFMQHHFDLTIPTLDKSKHRVKADIDYAYAQYQVYHEHLRAYMSTLRQMSGN